MRLFGMLLHPFFARPVALRATAACIGALVLEAPAANGYVLDGNTWSSGTVVTLQLGLGSAGRTLQDGNTSWDDAVLPVADTWNQVLGRVRITNTLNPQAPVTSGDRVNAVVFSNSVFGQSFGASTLAVTY